MLRDQQGLEKDFAPQTTAWVWALGFLLVTVPLVPFRYLSLPASFPAHLLPLVQYIPAGICLALGIGCYWQRRWSAESLKRLPLGVPVLVLFLTGMASSVGAEQPLASMGKTCYYFLTGALLYLVMVALLRPGPQTQRLLLLFLASGYLVSACGILEFLLGHNLLYSSLFTPENEAYRRLIPDPWFGKRITSTIGHPVALGSYLVLVLPISLATALGAHRKSLKALLLLGTLSVFCALLLTFTRGAWIAGIVAICIYLKLRGARYLLALPGILAVLAGVVLSFSEVRELAVDRLQDTSDNYLKSFASTTRGAAYAYTAAISAEHPVVGLGTGMYRFAAYSLRRTMSIPTPLGVLDTPDNMYLVWLAENGALGLIAALYVLAALFRHLWLAGKLLSDKVQQGLVWGLIAAFGGLCVDMLTVDALSLPVTRTVFWLVAGLAVVQVAPENANSESGRSILI